jgi:hypothetical protein
MARFRKILKLTAIALAIVAVVEQLRRAPADRTWEGQVAGIVPYDFRKRKMRPRLRRSFASTWRRLAYRTTP